MSIPRPEHPRPHLWRKEWQNLNGTWQFEIDNSRSGEERGLMEVGHTLSDSILVPFCPESRLSGVGHTDFLYGVWYKRTVELGELTGRVLLHFGAVDYEAAVYVNGEKVGTHKGGYVSFTFDITPQLHPGVNELAVYAQDDTRSRLIPSGKQSPDYASRGCCYTRTTGIWQTVWLEFVPRSYIASLTFTTEASLNGVSFSLDAVGQADLEVEVSYEGTPVGHSSIPAAVGHVEGSVALSQQHLWEPGCGRLYDVTLRFGEDTVRSYFGLRTLRFDGHRFLLNEKPVFQRLILDQGFYPDGIYTAPTDAALEGDIRMSMAAGFNGARLHEKIFEERFLYHADRLGYLVWGEYPNWGLDISYPEAVFAVLPEWIEELRRDRSHPSIVGWCPFNETWDIDHRGPCPSIVSLVYDATKAIDPTRPCIDTSGGYHVKTDIFCVHDYDQDPASLRARYEPFQTEGKLIDRLSARQTYRGEPCFVSEYGGIGWNVDQIGWSYGNAPKTAEEWLERFRGLTEAILQNRELFGFCYTQLTDIEQEQNGIYTYARQPKFDPALLHAIVSQPAAMEEE